MSVHGLLEVPRHNITTPRWWPTFFDELPTKRDMYSWEGAYSSPSRHGSARGTPSAQRLQGMKGAKYGALYRRDDVDAAGITASIEKMIKVGNLPELKGAILQADQLLLASTIRHGNQTGNKLNNTNKSNHQAAALVKLRAVVDEARRAVLPGLIWENLRAALRSPRQNVDIVKRALADATDKAFVVGSSTILPRSETEALLAEARAVLPVLAEKRLRFAISRRSNAPRHLRQVGHTLEISLLLTSSLLLLLLSSSSSSCCCCCCSPPPLLTSFVT